MLEAVETYRNQQMEWLRESYSAQVRKFESWSFLVDQLVSIVSCNNSLLSIYLCLTLAICPPILNQWFLLCSNLCLLRSCLAVSWTIDVKLLNFPSPSIL
jgi:hypothetical protein